MTYFVDTNVLVYSRDASEPVKQRQAHEWLTHLWETRSGRVSFQVLQEYYVTVTAKLRPGLAEQEARDDVRQLLAWRPVTVDSAMLESAWALADRFRLSFWDATIAAGARLAGCDRLITEDLQDGQDLDGVVVVDPFVHEPESHR